MILFVLVFSVAFVSAMWALCFAFGLPLALAGSSTAAVAIVLAGMGLWKLVQARRAQRQIEQSLSKQAKQLEQRVRPDQQSEIRALGAQFDAALKALKSSRLGRGGAALYALPWYVIIGPPGAGKSTAIKQSGLKFPLQGAQGSVRGVGGTRNCDWWLTNEAVLLDTAGRYATEDDDRDEWLTFLEMLRRARPRRPLNGVIVAVSVADLLAAKERELDALGERVRERVDEVLSTLGLVLPIYLLLTKCDLLPGFVDSFEALDREERSQVFGFTFAVRDESDLAERVEQQWTRLVQVAERRSLLCMGDGRGQDARRGIYEFPQQLEALRANVVALVSSAFVHNVYRDAPIMRGVYLTSGTQEGAPIDRLAASMAEAFGLGSVRSADVATEPRSYFLAGLFREVMFPDRDLASRSTAGQRRRELLRIGVAALLLCSAAALAIMPVGSYLSNRELVRGARAELSAAIAYKGGDSEHPVPLEVLEPIRRRLAALRAWSNGGHPWSYGAGLYQGERLLPSLQCYYASTLRTVLLQPLVRTLEARMDDTLRTRGAVGQVPGVRDHAQVYAQLRAYLLLTSPTEAGQPILTDGLQAWLSEQLVETWQGDTQSSPAERQAMTTHIAAYLALLAVEPTLAFARSTELVARAREFVARVPTVKLAVDRVVAELEPLGLDLSSESVLGASGLPISAVGRVRGAFTRRAWDEHVGPLFEELPPELLGDAWVLEAAGKDDRTFEARRCAVRSEYFARYIDEWRAFVGALRVEEPVDHRRALVVLQDLTRGQPPPLERIARTVAHNARLIPPKPPESEAEKVVEQTGLLAKVKAKAEGAKLGALLGKRDPCAVGDFLTEHSVRNALQGFFAFGAVAEDAQAGAPAQLTAVQVYQEQLSYLRDALQAYLDDPATAEPLLARLSTARTRVRSLIETQEVGWRPRFDALLWPPVNGASASSTSALASEKGSQWCTSIVLPYARTLRDRYPFSRLGQDAALADLAEFYRPESGIVWAFYATTLKREVAQVGGKFELRDQRDGPAMYSSELTSFLERSFHLSNVLFPPRAEKPRVDFEVRVRPAPGIAQVLLTIDGQLVDFHNGPEKWVHITWPGPGEDHGARMRVKGAHIDESLAQEGEWGLFRLLDKGTIRANSSERFFTVTWRLHTQNDVVIDVRPARVENPFVGSKSYLEAFRAEQVAVPRAISTRAKPCLE